MDHYYENNHVRLGEWLVKNNKIDEQLKNKLKGLERYFHGGGSPTLTFLNANTTRNSGDTVGKLKEFAKDKKRYDVANLLEGIPDNKLLNKLEDDIKTEIADLLDRHSAGAVDWTVFAQFFGFDHA